MSTIKDALSIYKRDMLIFKSRLKANLIRSIIFPLVILLFFGNLGQTAYQVPIGVVNLANNKMAFDLISYLQSQNTLKLQTMSEALGFSALSNGTIAALIVIPPGGNSIYIYYSPTSSNAQYVLPAIESAASKFELNIETREPTQLLYLPQKSNSNIFVGAISGLEINYLTFLIAGVIAMVAAFSSMMNIGFTIISERQLGNLKALFLTPLSSLSYILGKLLSSLTQGLIYVSLVIIIGIPLGEMFAMGFIPTVLLTLFLSSLLLLGFSGLAILLALRTPRVDIYGIIANTIVLPLWFLSGAFFPTSLMPQWMQSISAVDPLTYAVNGIRSVMIAGTYPISQALIDVSILVLFAAFTILLAKKLFKLNV